MGFDVTANRTVYSRFDCPSGVSISSFLLGEAQEALLALQTEEQFPFSTLMSSTL